ncbi:hypothetical protein YB2330_005278 [Saitoella coloradoensis]
MGNLTSRNQPPQQGPGVVTYINDDGKIVNDTQDIFKSNLKMNAIYSSFLDEKTAGESTANIDLVGKSSRLLFEQCADRGVFGRTGFYGRSAVCIREDTEYVICNDNIGEMIPTEDLHTYASALDMELVIFIDHPLIPNVPLNILKINLLEEGQTLQVFDNLSQLRRARLDQPTAFFREEGIMVVWSQEAGIALTLAKTVQAAFEQISWDQAAKPGELEVVEEKKEGRFGFLKKKKSVKAKTAAEAADLEANEDGGIPLRRREIQIPIYVMLSIALGGIYFGLLLRSLMIEYRYDGSVIRFAYVAYFPVAILMFLYFNMTVVSSVGYIIGPFRQVFRNSFAYSAIPPKRIMGALPPMTVICPVYKESLNKVIDPTITSVKAAMHRYERQGGVVNLILCDDRMQLISTESQEFRKEYYRRHNIGWVARPGHGVDGYIRAGRFKKASNMNAMLGLSVRVEEALRCVERPEGWSLADEERAYNDILEDLLQADGRLWAEGNIRIGELFLIIDSDTRVPNDCLIDAASEFAQTDHLAVLQHVSGVMEVDGNFFEKGMTYFTDVIYRAIQYSCAAGDVAPFVGHNAFLRWSAVQRAARYMHEDGTPRWWSESHVSEDFEMALKLQCAGYSVRLAAYTNGDFKEGVSLTVHDEITRWEKYAYGCSELLFHPLRQWVYKGPFTPLFRRFLWAPQIPFFGKVTLLGYIGTYYALGGTWIFVTVNYFLTGWFSNIIDHMYQQSFDMMFGIMVVFGVVGSLGAAISRYRGSDTGIITCFVAAFGWTPFLCIYFNGISLHISRALLSHMFEYNMQWGATAKEVEDSNLFKELKKIAKSQTFLYIYFGLHIPMMIYLACYAPYQWQIPEVNAWFPLALSVMGHMLVPIALNPNLLKL